MPLAPAASFNIKTTAVVVQVDQDDEGVAIRSEAEAEAESESELSSSASSLTSRRSQSADSRCSGCVDDSGDKSADRSVSSRPSRSVSRSTISLRAINKKVLVEDVQQAASDESHEEEDESSTSSSDSESSDEEETRGSIILRQMLAKSVEKVQRENLEATVGEKQANTLPEGNDNEVLAGGADDGNSDQRDESSKEEDESDSSGSSSSEEETVKEEYGEELRELKKDIKEYKEEVEEEDEPAQRSIKSCKVVLHRLPATATLAGQKRPVASTIRCDDQIKKYKLDEAEMAGLAREDTVGQAGPGRPKIIGRFNGNKCSAEGCKKILIGKRSQEYHWLYHHGGKIEQCQECDWSGPRAKFIDHRRYHESAQCCWFFQRLSYVGFTFTFYVICLAV